MKRNAVASQELEALLYARVSSDEQEKEGFSIPAQMKLLEEYAVVEGFRVLKPYVDIETAKQPGRPGFEEMVEFFRSRLKARRANEPVPSLLVEKTDRLYRNLKDYVTVDELKIDIHFVKENFVLSPNSHSSQKFMHGIKVLLAKNYIDNLSEETRKGLQEKAEQGIWPLKAPSGYRNVIGANGKRGIEPNPDIAPIIRKIFEWYATGNYSLDEIANMAREAGLVLPRSKQPLGKGYIHKILQNPIYYGDFRWKGKLYQGNHAPLITRELWDQVQNVLNRRWTKKTRHAKHNFAFSGLITCGHCGCAVVGEIQKGRYVYYHCTGHKEKCPEPYVREEVLETKFADLLRQLVFDAEILEWLTATLRESYQEEKEFHKEAIVQLRAEHDRLQRRIEGMYLDKLDGRVDAAFFDRKSAEWHDEQRRLLDAIEKHINADQSFMDEGVVLMELAQRAAELFEKQNAGEKRRLLNFVLSNCSWKAGELTPEFRQPFDMIALEATACAKEKAAGVSSDGLRLARGG